MARFWQSFFFFSHRSLEQKLEPTLSRARWAQNGLHQMSVFVSTLWVDSGKRFCYLQRYPESYLITNKPVTAFLTDLHTIARNKARGGNISKRSLANWKWMLECRLHFPLRVYRVHGGLKCREGRTWV